MAWKMAIFALWKVYIQDDAGAEMGHLLRLNCSRCSLVCFTNSTVGVISSDNSLPL